MGKKKYIQPKAFNPIVQARKIDDLQIRVDRHGRELDMVIKSYDNHVEHLANFAQHDMKNAIQSMDSILYTTDYKNIKEEEWESLKTCLKNIRTTFDNFSKLNPHSKTKIFTIDRLLIALDILTRYELNNAGIKSTINFPKNSDVELSLPFQSVLQMLHNLVINSIKSLEEIEEKVIEINTSLDNDECKIEIYDNGNKISEELVEKIFEYGYTTTGGTGVGLYHAKYVCKEIKGEIVVFLNPTPTFTKKFVITIPLTLDINE